MASEWDVVEHKPVDTGWEVVSTDKRPSLNIKERFEAKPTRSGAVVKNSIMEAVAAFPDMFINAPSNIMNLGRAAGGSLEHLVGTSGLASNIQEPPNVIRNLFEKNGLITPQAAPETGLEGYLSAGTGGAAAGAMGGLPGMAMGAASNLIGHGVSDFTESPTAGLAASLLAPFGANKAAQYGAKQLALSDELKRQKTPLTDTMAEVRNAGYVMSPATTNPTWTNKILESIGGKAASKQDASMHNQATTDAVVRKGIRAPSDMPITEDALLNLRNTAAQPYNDMTSLAGLPPKQVGTQLSAGGLGPVVPMYGKTPPIPDQLVHDWKSTNAKASLTWKEYEENKKVESLDRYNALRERSAQIERDLEAAAQHANRPDMVDKLRQARVEIAKIHDVERALNPSRGETSAIDFARAKGKGVPFTGDLLTVAKMGEAFPTAVRRPEQIGSPGVNNLNSMIGGGAGASLGAALTGGNPVGAGAGAMAGAVATPYIQGLVRQLLLSKGYQKSMGTPNYDAGMIGKTASRIPMSTSDEALLRAYILSQQQGQ